MKIISWILFLYFIYIQRAYALPASSLYVGIDYILLLAPIFLWVFTVTYIYFLKYIRYISTILLIINIFLYIIYCTITENSIFFDIEYTFLILIFVLIIFLPSTKTYIYLGVISILCCLLFFLIYIQYNLFHFTRIWHCIKNNIHSDIKITKTIYKSNFLAIYGYNIQSEKNSYIVIWTWDDVLHCSKKWKYHICNGGSYELWDWLFSINYWCIK